MIALVAADLSTYRRIDPPSMKWSDLNYVF